VPETTHIIWQRDGATIAPSIVTIHTKTAGNWLRFQWSE